MNKIDINCDLGEGMANDERIMPYISSCNISCGAHAGDMDILVSTLLAAKKHKVKIGAHPSYPDRENFGRIVMKMGKSALEESILSQLLTFQQASTNLNVEIHHIKPHGALYNQAAIDPDTAALILELMKSHFPSQTLYAPYGSVIASLAPEYGIKVWYEAFADRNYADDLTLIPRTHSSALKLDVNDIIKHIELMVNKQQVKTLTGRLQNLKVDTICIHGDNPNAETIAKAISENWERIL